MIKGFIRQEGLLAPHDAVAVRLDFHTVETILADAIRMAGIIFTGHGSNISDPGFSVPEEDQQAGNAKRNNIFYFGLPAGDQERGNVSGSKLLQIAVILRTAAFGKHQQFEFIIFPQVVLFQDASDVLAVRGNNALLDPQAAPVAVDTVLAPFDKG